MLPDMKPPTPPMGMPSAGSGMKPEASDLGGAEVGPEEIKSQLVGLLTQAKKMAEANGVEWSSVLSEVSGNASKSSASVPRPPRPDFPASPLG
jgi:hypothetical protein